MNPEIANVITERIAQQLGSMMLDLLRLQAEKEVAEKALAVARKALADACPEQEDSAAAE